MAYTLDRVTRECEAIARQFGRELNCPVSLNGRLRTTLGRVTQEKRDGVWRSVKIEFSRNFIEKASDAEIIETIRHEMAHWLATAETGEEHNHDAYWKTCAIRCGASPEATYDRAAAAKLEAQGAIKMAKPKYSIYCSKCHKLVATRTRACKVTENTSAYHSSCCKAKLICVKEF